VARLDFLGHASEPSPRERARWSRELRSLRLRQRRFVQAGFAEAVVEAAGERSALVFGEGDVLAPAARATVAALESRPAALALEAA